MNDPRLSRFPFHAWLGYWERVRPGSTVFTVCRRQVAFYVGFMGCGRASVRWVHGGHERRFEVADGTVRIAPADGEWHTLVASHSPGNAFFTLVIPQAQMEELAASEGVACPVEWRHMLCPHDPVLRWCMERLSSPTQAGDDAWDGHKDEAARQLMLRVLELHGRSPPSWRWDACGFGQQTLAEIVAYIDAHLRPGPLLGDMGPLVGVSPSHFARKFRRSTGLSLQQFVNLRRLQASLPMLRDTGTPLPHVAIDLGFASQSHFTRLFGEVTGMTPAKFRKQCRPAAVRGGLTGVVETAAEAPQAGMTGRP